MFWAFVCESRHPMSEKRNPAVSGPFFQHAGRCPACGAETTFVAEGPYFRNTLKCTKCRSAPRHRAARVVAVLPTWHSLKVHESSPGWDNVSQRLARECRDYTASQYGPSTPSDGIAKKVIEKGADYVLAVRRNQGQLHGGRRGFFRYGTRDSFPGPSL